MTSLLPLFVISLWIITVCVCFWQNLKFRLLNRPLYFAPKYLGNMKWHVQVIDSKLNHRVFSNDKGTCFRLYENEGFDADNSKIYDLWNRFFFLLSTFWKNTRTCYIPSMKMVAMSSLHPLRWITRDNYWYFGYSAFIETRITRSTFYIVKLSFFAHFKGHFGFHFLLNIKELPNNNH